MGYLQSILKKKPPVPPTPACPTQPTKHSNMEDLPEQAPFNPTHLIYLDELDQNEKEIYYDLLIAADTNFHRNHETGEVMADMRILGPGVKIQTTPPKKPADASLKRLNPKEKLAVQALKNQNVSLPGAIACDNGDIFDYKRYEAIVKLIRGAETPKYAPKRRPLAWVMKLIHEIYDVRYARDTSDINDEDEWDETDPEAAEARRKEEEFKRNTNVFPIFVVDMFSKKYGLKNLVENTMWDLLYR